MVFFCYWNGSIYPTLESSTHLDRGRREKYCQKINFKNLSTKNFFFYLPNLFLCFFRKEDLHLPTSLLDPG